MLTMLINEDDWIIVVLKSKSDNATSTLVYFYRYAEGLIGVKDLHFLVQDRLDDSVIFSFRLLVKSKEKKDLENAISFHLGKLFAEGDFAVNPEPEHLFSKYVAWSWKDTVEKRGLDKFTMLCGFLSKFSRMVVEMAEKGYFSSKERIEIAHFTTWILGCTEYGLLSEKSWEIGYYDRIADKYNPYLAHTFKKGT